LQETDSDPAEFKIFGPHSADLSIQVTGLIDGDFEKGDLSQNWNVAGDARVIAALGNDGPTDGTKMAIISTGLGFTTDYGTLSQKFTLQATPGTVSFKWNMYSEEWQEWVGSQYQDSFSARIYETANPANELKMVSETIDSLAAGVSKVEVGFDKGDVYATGWRMFSGSLPPALLGKAVTIEFQTHDVGDSVWDSAVLIDSVKVVQQKP
jgi:hypothetical protein